MLPHWSHEVRDAPLDTCSGCSPSVCHARAVTTAKTSQEALNVFRSGHGQRVDLVLTDHVMPKVCALLQCLFCT